MTDKLIVHYLPDWYGNKIKIGAGAIVCPVDHTSYLVSNETCVWTSTVLNYDEYTGIFETEYTIYQPLENENEDAE